MKRSAEAQFEFKADSKKREGPRVVVRARRALGAHTSAAPPASSAPSTSFSFGVSAAQIEQSFAALDLSDTVNLTPERFRRRFRELGVALADALGVFSLDLVALVARYLEYGRAAANAKLQLTLAIGLGWESHECRGVACAPNGDILVAQNSCVTVLDSNGVFMFSISPLSMPRGIAFDDQGAAYITTAHDGVIRAQLHEQKWTPFAKPAKLAQVLACAFDNKSGRLFVPVARSSSIQVFNKKDGSFAHTIDYDSHNSPGDIAVAANGELFVHFPATSKVEIFSQEGKSLWSFRAVVEKDTPLTFSDIPAESGLCLDRDGNIMVCASNDPRLRIFHPNGALLTACTIEGLELTTRLSGRDPAVDKARAEEAQEEEKQRDQLGFATAVKNKDTDKGTSMRMEQSKAKEKPAKIGKLIGVAAGADGKIYIAHNSRMTNQSGVCVFAFEA